MLHVLKASSGIQDAQPYDVNPHSGFMPPEEPIARLPISWEPWEAILDAAISAKLQLGDKLGLSEKDRATSRAWRASVCRLPILSITELQCSNILLRRAHLVLTFVMHFYIQSLPPHDPVVIPRPISLPLLRVSSFLDMPSLLTFSDTVLYNWMHKDLSPAKVPALDNMRTRTMFTGLIDEEEFYLCSARIELRGVEALELMKVTMDEIFVGDQTAVRRITGYLEKMAIIIQAMKTLLMDVRKGCIPEVYYNEVRPWFRGEDSDENKRKWEFEGLEEDPSLKTPTELSGPSAGQSSIVHLLDVFLGVDHQSSSTGQRSFMSRMQSYMPRNHRLFLDHISSNPQPLRAFVMSSSDASLRDAYNSAVLALKEFRGAHMIIAALYILGPARRAAKQVEMAEKERKPLLGTGGTELVKFLKDTRTRTTDTMIPRHLI
ncbi:hypothetical protein C0991_008446 [Blastosporella zonata]|nr:hypothetical protein C0991_008446 [Blastosporella zonata]